MNAPLPAVLIVDDNSANRDTLAELLGSANYRLVEAADGPDALRLAASAPPDLILLDVMMPGMDGYEVCRRVRADRLLAEVPVIMVTALDDQASRIAGIDAGADDFITKPFNRSELRARVRTITRLNRYRRIAETQAALRESEVRFRTLAEQCDEAFRFVTLNPEKIVYVSPALEVIWGRPAADFLADAGLWAKTVHPDDQKRVHDAYQAVLDCRADRFAEEYRILRPDGAVRWVLDSVTPIRNTVGRVLSVGGVARDITERKVAEDVLLRAQRLENIGMLAAGIAHDFNNALAPLVMGCTVLRQHVNEATDGLRVLDMMEKSAGRSVALVRQLLSFARGSSGHHQLVQIRYLLRELAELSEATFPKSVRVTAELPRNLWPVLANPTQIHQVFLNLCINARDAMPAGGRLEIVARNCTLDSAAATAIPGAKPGHFLAVAVRDTGTGIPPEVLPRIWEPFFTTKAEGIGTGLGLSTVRGILQQHDGFIAVATGSDVGTTFTVYLPSAETAVGDDGGAPPEAPGRGRGELILIVEDEEPLRAFAVHLLEGHGYRTVAACDGAEGIALFAPRIAEVRLVLTDLQMPMLGGAALATALHRLQPDLPVIGMSGDEQSDRERSKNFAAAFLVKPFHAETLLLVVRRTLDASRLPPL